MTYVFDTSALIALFRDGRYDKTVFPTMWENFDVLVNGRKIISAREVRREIERIDDELASWAQDHSELFSGPNGQQTQFIRKLFENEHFQGLVKHKTIVSGGPVADPFVVALAYDVKGCVVTQEKEKPNAPCIPTVCREYSVDCTDLTGFMKKEGWSF